MAWYWIVLFGIMMFLVGFFSAALAAASKRADEASAKWVKSNRTLTLLALVLSSACTTVNCPPEPDEKLRAWAMVEVLPIEKGTHAIEVVVLQLILDETDRISEGDTLQVFRALDLLQHQQANVVLTYQSRWELEVILNESW